MGYEPAVLVSVESLTCEESLDSLSSGISNFQRSCTPGSSDSGVFLALSTENARSTRAQAERQVRVPWLGSDFPATFSDRTFDLFPHGPWSVFSSVWVLSCILWHIPSQESEDHLCALCLVLHCHLPWSSVACCLTGTLATASVVGGCISGVGTRLPLSHLNPS